MNTKKQRLEEYYGVKMRPTADNGWEAYLPISEKCPRQVYVKLLEDKYIVLANGQKITTSFWDLIKFVQNANQREFDIMLFSKVFM